MLSVFMMNVVARSRSNKRTMTVVKKTFRDNVVGYDSRGAKLFDSPFSLRQIIIEIIGLLQKAFFLSLQTIMVNYSVIRVKDVAPE
jgi:hypothetical protein